jgi:two-component system, OmpR family, sensor kinase
MGLRTRLAVAFVLLLLVVVAIAGVVVVESSRRVLTDQIDEDLKNVQLRFDPLKFSENVLLKQIEKLDTLDRDPKANSEAIVIVEPDGIVRFAQSSGFPDDPDPLPDISAFPSVTSGGDIFTISSEDGTLNYRAFGWTDDGEVGVWAVPLDEVDAAVSGILRTFLLIGVVVAVFGGAVTWWTVQRGLKPVDRMVDTATTIAGGDLTQRVLDTNPSTELGRLGAALNEMLAQIEDAFTHEQVANERLKQFVADASHELRTPIAAINGYSELYRSGALQDQVELDNAMRRIGTETTRMQRLVADLLLLARLDREQSLERRSINLAAVVRDAASDSMAIERDRPVTVHGPDSLRVIGDEQLLSQIIANLLANTRTHTPEGTPVAITLGQDNGDITLNVVDDGPGLPESGGDKLFERFYRLDGSRGRTNGGAGLGLAIVAAIARAHGGSVDAANEDGHGARFTVTLPAEA